VYIRAKPYPGSRNKLALTPALSREEREICCPLLSKSVAPLRRARKTAMDREA